MNNKREPIFDADEWCYDMKACPASEDLRFSYLDKENKTFVTMLQKYDTERFSKRYNVEIYAWKRIKEILPAKLPEKPNVIVTGLDSLRALLDGKFLKEWDDNNIIRVKDNLIEVYSEEKKYWDYLCCHLDTFLLIEYEVLDNLPPNVKEE